jgi:hypothetical protein
MTFLDPVRRARLHLLIRKRLLTRLSTAVSGPWRARGRGNTWFARHVLQSGYHGAGKIKENCFAKENLSAAQAPARQDARLPRAYEDQGWPQGAGGAPQEGTPSAHARVIPGASSFPGWRGWCGGENLTLCTAPGSAARVPTSLFSFARTNCPRAASASASKKRWAARWCAIVSGDGFARWCAAIAWRYL